MISRKWASAGPIVHREAYRLSDMRGWARYGIAFGLGALTATALAPYYFLPALLMGFTGLVILLDGAVQSQTPKRMAFLTGWAFGFGYFLFGMYWLGFAFLVQADQFGWMIPFAIPAFTGFLGLFCAAPCLLAIMRWKASGRWRIVLLAALWALFEWLRGNILTGLPWNLTSQTMAGTALLGQPLAWLGPYGYSLLLLGLAMLPALVISRPGRLDWRPLAAVGLGIVGILFFGAARLMTGPGALTLPADTSFLQIVQPNIAQRDKNDPAKQSETFQTLVDLTAKDIRAGQSTLAVWPENADPRLGSAADAPAYFAAVLPENVSLAAGSIRIWEEDGQQHFGNSVILFGETTTSSSDQREKPVVATYDKHHLVPFGEYLPLKGVLMRLGLSQLAPVADGFTPGSGPTVLEAAGIRFSPLICYEDIFPRRLYPSGERPDLLVVVTNDAWFGDNAGPRQHFDISRMRVIESGLPMARSANTGISAVFDSRGRALETVPLYEVGVISHYLPPASSPTLYQRIGEWPFVLLLLFAAVMIIRVNLARQG